VSNEIEDGQRGDMSPVPEAPAVPAFPAEAGSELPYPSASSDVVDLDQLSAVIRADATDTDSFFRVLATKLADALGERVQIRREGGMFKRDKAAVGISVDLANGAGVVLEANRKGNGIECTVSRPVRGIVISSKPVSLAEWLDSLAQALAKEAQQSEQTWAALHGLLA
jgi:hypothetical protein